MFRDKSGNIGYVGSALEATAQFGVAMTETAAGMAQCAGDLTGALYEKTSYTFRSYFE